MEGQNSAIINHFYYVGERKEKTQPLFTNVSLRWPQHSMITSRATTLYVLAHGWANFLYGGTHWKNVAAGVRILITNYKQTQYSD